MKLGQLLKVCKGNYQNCTPDTEVGKICYDSRKVQPGDVFVAVRGYQTDGHAYIEKARQAGAVVIVCEAIADATLPVVLVEDTRIALAEMASAYFDYPAQKMQMIGITGTNGKTTTTYLVKHMLEAQGYKVGLIGTNQNMIGQTVLETERTTPESFELQALFAQMVQAGCTHVVMEVSSHALMLERVRGISFAVGAFTNLTQDHLDFHQTMEQYCDAKARLFRQCRVGILNGDDPMAGRIMDGATCQVRTFSVEEHTANLYASDIQMGAQGVSFVCQMGAEQATVLLGIPGMFSVHNALCAIGCVTAVGVSLQDACKALYDAKGVKGRAEVVPTPTDYTVLIDYAHSPDGVENILRAVRGFAKGRVVAIFGCGGDRDKTKRPKMGKIAAELADFCVITSDNPRTEDPEVIVQDILVGVQDCKTPHVAICDRREAIVWALDHAQEEDVLVFMGKGHETYQEIHHVKYHLDEREEIAQYFANRKEQR